MKKSLKVMFLSFVCLFCLLLNTGCGCDRPISVKYVVSVTGDTVSSLTVGVTTYQKYREPASTPCYRKMKAGYVRLKSADEIALCANGEVDCYKKVGKKYELITEMLDVQRCITEQMSCYENVAETYYKLLPEGDMTTACYDEYGNKFERDTYNTTEKEQLTKFVAIDSTRSTFEAEARKLSKVETESLLYEFKITNNSSESLKINYLTKETIFKDAIVDKSINKVKVAVSKANDNGTITLTENESVTVIVEVKYMTKKDLSSDVVKDLTFNIPITTTLVSE